MRRRILHTAASLTITALHAATAVEGQEVVEWSSLTDCEPCELPLTPIVRLGEREGDGTINSDFNKVVSAAERGYAVFTVGGGQAVAVFDEGGRFVRSIGRTGQGPGELQGVADAAWTAEGQLVVLDYGRSAWITFDGEGGVVTDQRLQGVRAAAFRLLPERDRAVVGVFDRRPEVAGYPFHVVDLRSGRAIGHFGQANARWTMDGPFGGQMLFGQVSTDAPSVWWSKVGEPHLEEWSLDGRLLRTIRGELPAFPINERPTLRDPPQVVINDFAIDDHDRLWLVTLVPDERWADVRRGIEGGVPMSEYHRYRDARLDVFDLADRQHIGSRTWDPIGARLVQKGGTVMVSTLEYEDAEWPRLVLYGMQESN